MSILALTALMSMGAAVPERPLSYDEAVRCAGLTQAASELEGDESALGRTLADAAVSWSASALQIAVETARPAATAEADQTEARIRAVRELDARPAQTREALRDCLARVPRPD